MIKIDFREEEVDDFLGSHHVDIFKSNVEGLSKFLFVHNSFRSLGVEFLLVQSLNSHLSKMLLNAEIGQFVVGDLPVVVPIIPEDVFDHVEDLILVFFQQTDHGVADFFLIEFVVFVHVVGNQTFQYSLPHLFGEGVV